MHTNTHTNTMTKKNDIVPNSINMTASKFDSQHIAGILRKFGRCILPYKT